MPEAFPAVVLWQFRLASLGAQMILWAILGLGFGAWTERAAVAENSLRLHPVGSLSPGFLTPERGDAVEI